MLGAQSDSVDLKGGCKEKRLTGISIGKSLQNSLSGKGNKSVNLALAGVAQWIECWPVNQRVASLIPSQGTCLDCGQLPSRGHARSNHTLMFLTLPSPLSKNK